MASNNRGIKIGIAVEVFVLMLAFCCLSVCLTCLSLMLVFDRRSCTTIGPVTLLLFYRKITNIGVTFPKKTLYERSTFLRTATFLSFVIHNLLVPITTLNHDVQAVIAPTRNHLICTIPNIYVEL